MVMKLQEKELNGADRNTSKIKKVEMGCYCNYQLPYTNM